MGNTPDNLLIFTFNYNAYNTYHLLLLLGKNIGQALQLIKYFENESDLYKYALFHTRLEYFNTDIFLIKNFYLKQNEENTLFAELNVSPEYLVNFKPPQMYILLIYSDEIKNISQVNTFIKPQNIPVLLTPLHSKKLKKQLHFSVQQIHNQYNTKKY